MLAAILLLGVTVSAMGQQPDTSPMNQKKFAISKDDIKTLISDKRGAFATDQIMVERKKIGYMYREKPDRPEDSGWRFFSGDEDQAYVDDPSHTAIYTLNTIANYDPDIIPYLDCPAPCAFERITGTHKYKQIKK